MPAIQILATTAPLLLGLIAIGAVRATKAMRALYPQPLVRPAVQDEAPPHDANRLTAAVLLDHNGTEVSDFLLPYELLAASGAFNVYGTAPAARPAVLTGGLDVQPHVSHRQFDDLPIDRADLVVVPHMPNPAPAVVSWIRNQADRGATILSICTGAGVAAMAGVFDGRSATAHWGDLARFERRYPQVDWVRGVRFVDGGDVAASAGITSGIDATLHIIRRFAGQATMQRAADAIGYTDLRYLNDPTAEQYRPSVADAAVMLRTAFARRPTIGVLLRDGVDETALAAAIDTYGSTFTGRMRTMTPRRRAIRTRHGLTLIPRCDAQQARTARVLAPHAEGGAPAPGAMRLPAAGPPYAAIQEALDDLARTAGRPVARFAAKRLEHRSTAG